MSGQANAAVLEWLFEAPIATAWLALDDEVPALMAEEAGLLASASAGRQTEFAGGRACARRALERLGLAARAIGRGAEGQPLWPDGIVGAISHAGGVCVAAVGRSAEVAGIGVDIEVDGPESSQLTHRICSSNELAAIGKLGVRPEELSRVVFSAKETLYKLQFPLTGQALGIRRVEVILSPNTFVATFGRDLPAPILGAVVHGRWQRSAGLVWTGAWLRRV